MDDRYGDDRAAAHVLERLEPLIRARARGSVPPRERMDMAQNLRLAVIERLPKHDPTKATVVGFGAMVVDHAHVSLHRRNNAQKRTPPGPLRPIDAARDRAHDPWEHVNLQIDVQDAIKALKPELRPVARGVMQGLSDKSIASSLGIGVEMVARRREEMRQAFTDAGLNEYAAR